MTQPRELSKLKVAIVHDWLVGGGAELVVERLHHMFPDAPIYTSYCTDEWRQRLDNRVVTGWLQRFGKLRKFLPLARIWWFTHLNLSTYDLVISSSGAEAKAVNTLDSTIHINYCHAPTHYYWSRYDEYMARPGFGAFNWLARLGLKVLVGPLRRWDYRAAQKPDYIIANSTHIQAETKKYYHRDSTVIFPPVTFKRFQKPNNQGLARHGFVVSGRQTYYKRIDLAIQACTQLGLPLTVISMGPEHERLRALAGPTIKFLGWAPDEAVEKAFASAEALLWPGLDDFGITAIEALAAGTPVIAYKAGGALDYVVPGKTGEFFEEQTVESLIAALKSFKSSKYNTDDIKTFAKQFSEAEFDHKLYKYLRNIV
jgi:glycosyltransferase involved in cell wall biosynthesis